MLPKKNRISRADFTSIISNGKRFYSPFFTLYVLNTEKTNLKKVAFSVSKKVCKGAVGRNKLRRQGYSVIKSFLDKIKPGLVLVFVYKKASTIPKHKDIKADISELLKVSFVLI